MEKVCFKCGLCKLLTEFYKHPMMGDGHLGKCKVCTKADVLANRQASLDKYRAYDRERGNRQTLEDQHRYREENPKKRAAHVRVGNAIRDGKLIKAPCSCGNAEVHGHHDDYDKPLVVRWLCAACHKAWHSEHGEGANAH